MQAEDAISAVDHVQITIPSGAEDEARQFYCGVLGLTEIPKPASLARRDGFWLQVDGFPIHVGTEPAWDRLQTKAHIAYRVTDPAAWRSRLNDAGRPIEECVPIPGYDRFETRDPFGNRIEVIALNQDS